ncbi:phage regulatory CII family protein [Pseudomonas sp. NY15364]|uniref:phage regulatory CII family protein n=1 Tax=Pseudomonas sp. NY15364 TaxID=3400353 RepID=UPI003A843CA9
MQELMRAIYDVVDEHGASKIAQGASFSSRTLLSQKANPDYDSHKMNVEELHRIMAFTHDFRPLIAWADLFGFDLTARERPQARELTGALVHMHAEVADVTHVVSEALNSAHVNQLQRKAAEREITEAIASLQTLLESVKAA